MGAGDEEEEPRCSTQVAGLATASDDKGVLQEGLRYARYRQLLYIERADRLRKRRNEERRVDCRRLELARGKVDFCL